MLTYHRRRIPIFSDRVKPHAAAKAFLLKDDSTISKAYIECIPSVN